MDWRNAALVPGDWFRYGVSPEEKSEIEYKGVPGVFGGTRARDRNPYAERQASTYLGTKRWGPEAAATVQNVALGDLYDNWISLLSGKGLDPTAYNRNRAGTEAIDAAMIPEPPQMEEAPANDLLRTAIMGNDPSAPWGR